LKVLDAGEKQEVRDGYILNVVNQTKIVSID
jgi:hypothetical protein